MKSLTLIASLGAVLLFPLAPAQRLSAQESSSSQANPAAEPPRQETAPGKSQEPASPEVAKAEAAMLKNDWKTAEPILNAWLSAHPHDVRALFDTGFTADAQGRNDDAAAFYRRAIADDPRHFESNVSLGLLLARQGKSAEAKPYLETATQLDPGEAGPAAKAQAWRALARIQLKGSDSNKPDPAQASTDLLEALKLSPETPDDTLLAAQLAEANGDEPAAEAAYRRALAKTPGSAPATAGLAHSLIAEKKYPEAETLLRQGMEKSPDNPALTAQLAAVLVAQDKAEALPLLEKFHSQHPDEDSVTRMLAQVEADAGEYEAADKLSLALLQKQPQDADLLTGHGQNLIRLKRYSEAVQAFQNATKIDETNGDAWNGLAFAALQIHDPATTIHALTVRSKYLPESATIYFLWATAYDTLHDKKQAMNYYHRFLESAAGKFPDQEWQARQRLTTIEKSR